MKDKYLEFHRLKRDVINKLSSIEDGVRMDSLCNDFLEEISVSDRLTEISEMFEELQRIELVLISYEEN